MVSIEKKCLMKLFKAMLAIAALIVIGCRRGPEETLWPPNVPREPSAWMPGCYTVEFDTSGPSGHVKPVVLSPNLATGIERRQYYEVYDDIAGRHHLGVWQPINPNSLRIQMPATLGDATVTVERANNGILKATYYVVGDVGPRPSAQFLARVRKVECSPATESNPNGARP
jgi:hypothetical protein